MNRHVGITLSIIHLSCHILLSKMPRMAHIILTSNLIIFQSSAKLETRQKANRSDTHLPKSSRQPSKKSHSMNIKAPIGVDSRPLSTEKPRAPGTPENAHTSTDHKTSTPTNDGSYFPQEIDASAIHAETSVLSTGKLTVAFTLNRDVCKTLKPPLSQYMKNWLDL